MSLSIPTILYPSINKDTLAVDLCFVRKPKKDYISFWYDPFFYIELVKSIKDKKVLKDIVWRNSCYFPNLFFLSDDSFVNVFNNFHFSNEEGIINGIGKTLITNSKKVNTYLSLWIKLHEEFGEIFNKAIPDYNELSKFNINSRCKNIDYVLFSMYIFSYIQKRI